MQMREVPIGDLVPNSWNTNHITDPLNEQRLRNSMQEIGVFRPIVVRRLASGQLEILGGEHRWQQALALGHATIPVVDMGDIDDTKAKKIGLLDNARYGDDDPAQLSELLRELDVHDLATLMPFSQEELDSLTKVPDLPSLDDLDSNQSILPDLTKPAAAPSTQILRFEVPVEDVTWITSMVDRRQKEMGFKDESALKNAGNAMVSLLQELKKGGAK